MDMKLEVRKEYGYETRILGVMTAESWGQDNGWDSDYGNTVLKVQIPLRNGSDEVEQLIDTAIEEDAEVAAGKWRFACDAGEFREKFIPEMARQMHAMFLGVNSMHHYFEQEPYIYVEIKEKKE